MNEEIANEETTPGAVTGAIAPGDPFGTVTGGTVTGQDVYVVLSYAAFALGILGLVLWVVLPAMRQRRVLAKLERDAMSGNEMPGDRDARR